MKQRDLMAIPRVQQNQGAAYRGTCSALRRIMASGLAMLCLCGVATGLAAPLELGRLFYTPTQRAELENARAHHITQVASPPKTSSPQPLRYDGVLMRSDGQTTHWVDGKAQTGKTGVAGLKPGQIRAGDKVYEPYQVVRPPLPAVPVTTDTTP